MGAPGVCDRSRGRAAPAGGRELRPRTMTAVLSAPSRFAGDVRQRFHNLLQVREACRASSARVKAHAALLRTTEGAEAANRGADLSQVQDVVAHADPGPTTLAHAKSTPKKLRRQELARYLGPGGRFQCPDTQGHVLVIDDDHDIAEIVYAERHFG
jgi:hypothetical protein